MVCYHQNLIRRTLGLTIIKDPYQFTVTRRQVKLNKIEFICYVFQLEPKNVEESLRDKS